jgi:hypothetical protein
MSYDVQHSEVVPAPSRKPPKPRPRKYPFAELLPNTMFFVPGAKGPTMMSMASARGRELGVKFHTRHRHMRLVEGVWRDCAAAEPGATLGVAVYREK